MLDVTLDRDERVARFDVAVDQSARVCHLQPRRQLPYQLHGPCRLERSRTVQQRPQIGPFHVAHGHEQQSARVARLVDRHDPRVIDRGQEPRFGEEAVAVLPPGRDLFGRLADQLDDLRLRLGLGEQAIHLERLHLLLGRDGLHELADLGAIEIEAVTSDERSVRECGTGDEQQRNDPCISDAAHHDATSFRCE